MKIEINGQAADVPDNTSVTQLLTIQKVKMPDMVSVEINGNILDRKTFGTTTIKDGDKVEFLYFMGGGSFRMRGKTFTTKLTKSTKIRIHNRGNT